jgi:hypothetical protein
MTPYKIECDCTVLHAGGWRLKPRHPEGTREPAAARPPAWTGKNRLPPSTQVDDRRNAPRRDFNRRRETMQHTL